VCIYANYGLLFQDICYAVPGIACETSERIPVSVPGSGGFGGAEKNDLRLGGEVGDSEREGEMDVVCKLCEVRRFNYGY
jgi:hypothetical protein